MSENKKIKICQELTAIVQETNTIEKEFHIMNKVCGKNIKVMINSHKLL